MIKASELRIGNLVDPNEIDSSRIAIYHLGNDKWVPNVVAIEEIFSDHAECGVCNHPIILGHFQEHWQYPYEQLTGIPLTEEWMNSFGFKGRIYINFNKSIKLSIGDGIAFIGNATDTSGVAVQGIEFVHQLQNLYFVLTGEELQIKEA